MEEPAFPPGEEIVNAFPGRQYVSREWWPGMTLRDWFAGMVLGRIGAAVYPSATAAICYEMADAMMKARSQPSR